MAWELKKRGIAYTLFEKENRPGGWIRTTQDQGALFEWGPRSIRRADADATLALIDELSLSSEIIEASPEAKRRYLLEKGQLKVANGFSLLSFALIRDLFVSKCALEDESVYDFFSRRFSSHMAGRLIDPLVKGIYAGDPKTLSMRAAFPKIWELEQSSRSLILGALKQKKGKKGIITLKNGLGSLVEALSSRLDLELNSEVKALKFEGGKVQVNSQEFDHVISTLPAYALARLLAPGTLSGLLLQIPFVSVGVVHLAYKKPINTYQGFGYLVSSSEKEDILGVIFDSSVFPEHNGNYPTRLTVMTSRSEGLEKVALLAVAKHLQIDEAPSFIHSYVAKNCIPQYPVGFHHLLQEINKAKEEFPELSLLGTSFYGVSVNQTIEAARLFLATKTPRVYPCASSSF